MSAQLKKIHAKLLKQLGPRIPPLCCLSRLSLCEDTEQAASPRPPDCNLYAPCFWASEINFRGETYLHWTLLRTASQSSPLKRLNCCQQKAKQINKRRKGFRERVREREMQDGKQMSLQMSQGRKQQAGCYRRRRRRLRLSNDPWQPEGNVSQAQMINTLVAGITWKLSKRSSAGREGQGLKNMQRRPQRARSALTIIIKVCSTRVNKSGEWERCKSSRGWHTNGTQAARAAEELRVACARLCDTRYPPVRPLQVTLMLNIFVAYFWVLLR